MPRDVKKGKRKFLNPVGHADSGILEWVVDQYDEGVDAHFSIWDCSRKIVLDFSFYNIRGANQRAKKLDLLLEEMSALKEALADATSNSIIHYEEQDDS